MTKVVPIKIRINTERGWFFESEPDIDFEEDAAAQVYQIIADELAQIAIQGPASKAILQKLIGAPVNELKPRQCVMIAQLFFS